MPRPESEPAAGQAEAGRLYLPAALAADIHAQAAAAGQRECCGLLEGLRDGAAWRVTQLHPAANQAPAPDRFAIAPAAHFAARRAARARGAGIIGCYHSHPGGAARPSAEDARGAGEEDFVWLIAAGDGWGAFVWRGGVFLPLAGLVGQPV